MQGFKGSYAAVRRCVAPWRTSVQPGHTSERKRAVVCPSAERIAWLLLRDPVDRRDEDERLVAALCERCPEIRRATYLARSFALIVRERRASDLDGWITQP